MAILQWFEGAGIFVGHRGCRDGTVYMGYDAMCILVRLAMNVQKKLARKGIQLTVLDEFLSKSVKKFGE